MVSCPFQSVWGVVMVAILSVMSTLSSVFPVYVQVMSSSGSSMSVTYWSRFMVLKFQKILLNRNYTTNIRHSKGTDISAACGQLRAKADSGA